MEESNERENAGHKRNISDVSPHETQVEADGKKSKSLDETSPAAVDNQSASATNPTAQVQRPPKKKKVALLIGYCGTGFQGMQKNPGAHTIEDELEKAIFKAGGITADNYGSLQKVSWTRCARTDKGVHAAAQIISLKMIPLPGILQKINDELPPAIRVFGFKRVPSGFNSKKMCDCRTYEYIIPTIVFDQNTARHLLKVYKPKTAATTPAPSQDTTTPSQETTPAAPQEASPAAPSVPAGNAGGFVFDDAMKQRVNRVLHQFVGTHNFHNFTVGVSATDAEAHRFIMSFQCSDPFDIDGTQVVKLTVVGQSFMLHQIRKMVGLTIMMIRENAPINVVDALYSQRDVNIPMAPPTHLLLQKCHFDSYNKKTAEKGMKDFLVSFDDCQAAQEEFKREFIYKHLVQKEKSENLMLLWLASLVENRLDYDDIIESALKDQEKVLQARKAKLFSKQQRQQAFAAKQAQNPDQPQDAATAEGAGGDGGDGDGGDAMDQSGEAQSEQQGGRNNKRQPSKRKQKKNANWQRKVEAAKQWGPRKPQNDASQPPSSTDQPSAPSTEQPAAPSETPSVPSAEPTTTA